jgi:hypothetical protein
MSEPKTYLFIEKNGSGTLVLSAGSEDEAWEILTEKVKDPRNWRLEEEEDEY